MRIEYIKLENFNLVLSAMKRRVIEIDFSKSRNRVVLLIGDNGTGKTTILSQLHPFATPGNLDVRNAGTMIIPEKNGYKEIHIIHNMHKYIIKHFYLNKNKTKSVKSYISKDGEELNPNGNVTSFIDLVEIELGLVQDFLKLIRLGDNVTTFVKMKASERKNFTAQLLNGVDIYTKFYKKINDDTRVAKNLISSVSEKIRKLNIDDKKEEKQRLKGYESDLETKRSIIGELTSSIGSINGSIATLIDGKSIDMFNIELRILGSKYNDLLSDITTKEKKLSKYDNVSDIDKDIKRLTREIDKFETENKAVDSLIDFQFNNLNQLYDRKEERTNDLKHIGSQLEYSQLAEMYLQLNREKEKLSEKFKGVTFKCSKEDLMTALRLLQEIDKIVNDIHSFGDKGVKHVIELIRSGHNIESFVNKELKNIDSHMERLTRQLEYDKNIINVKKPDDIVFIFDDCDCEHCQYKDFYNEVMFGEKKVESKEDVDLNKELRKLEHKRDYYEILPSIDKNIDYIMFILRTNSKLIERLPIDFFNSDILIDNIYNLNPIYDEDYVTSFITLLEEYEEYISLDDRIKEVGREKSYMEKNKYTISSIQEELFKIDNEINTSETKLSELKEKKESLKKDYENNLILYDEYTSIESKKKEIDELKEECHQLEESIRNKNTIKDKVSVYIEKEKDLKESLKFQEQLADRLTKQIFDSKYRLKEYKELKEELTQLEESYEDLAIIRESLSSNKGVPLLFIQLYLKNTRTKINQLLDVVYDGDLEVQEFEIGEKEFRIPYISKGVKVEDVSFCSQGEESIVSLALSFALIEQSLNGYNILLLDEMDSKLDASKRMKFLPILEEQLDSIDAEQVFIITHNNAFDNYPVDVIMTSSYNVDNFKNVNVIFKAS